MTEPEKNNKRTKINVDSFVSNYMNTINSSDPAKSTSDGNTIFTEETESSMLTILRNSRRENIFDGRIKQYYKDKFFNKKGERNTTPRSRRYISKNKCFTFCKLRYKLSRNLIIVLGVLFILVSFGGIFLFLLLPKIAEILIRRSDLIIKEVDILKIGRQNGDPSFEINSIVNFGKSSSISSIKFIHSLLKISYSISSDENNMITRPLGELFISKVLARKNGDYFAKSRFTITNNDSLEALIKYYTSNIDNNDKPNIGLAGNRNIMFNTKGLMSLKIFGIRIDNIIIDKNINSNSIKNNDNDNKIKSLSFDNNDDNNIIIHNKWISVYGDGDIRINFEIETNVSKLLSKNQVHINQQDKKLMPSIVMNNIGDVWFNVFISDKLICRIIWFDFNIKSERNIWVFSIDFPDKISDKLMEDIINAIINDNNESNITLTIAGNYSENDAFNEIIKKINIKLPLKTLLNLLESEINNQKIVGSNILNKVIRYIKVGGVEFLNDSKSLKMRGNIGVGYVNPIGDSLPIIVNNISFNSVLSDELENNYGNIHLYLKKKPEVNMRKLSDKSNHSKNTVIELLYNDNLSVSSSNIKHKINSKYKIPIKETAETNKHNNHIEKCTNEKIKKENRHLLLKPCYNINEFEMELSIDTDKVKYEIKNEWIENVVSRRRKLALKNSVLNLNITSIFGNSLLKNIRIKRNLLNNKNKIKFTDNNQAYIDDDDYNFDDYYKDEDDELESNGENSKNLDIKNMSKLININDMKILGEGYNNSWITKLTIDEVNIFDKFGVNKLEIGSLGFIVSYNNETIGFMGTNDFKIGGNTKLTLIGVIKPEVDSTTNEINKSIVNIINSVLKGNISEIQDKSLTLEFKANQEEKEMCVKYFNYTKYLTDEDVNYWFKNKKLPILSEISEKNNSNNKRNWFEKFLNGQKINIPLNLLNEMYDFNIQKYVDKIVDNNTDIINNSLCFVQSLLNEDIMINEQNKKSVNGLSEIVSNKLKEYNIKISNASFQIFMATRESDLIIPINGLFSINIPRLITKNLFVNILYINYKLEFYDKDRKQKILSFDYFQNFNNINNEIINGTSINIVENKDFNLNVKIDNTEIILEDQNGQLMNIIKTIFGLPKSENEQVNNIELRSYISIGIQASIGIIKLNDIELYSTIRIPNCRKRLMKMEDKLNRQININSIFKVESIQVQKIRLIIPPRGIDIQLNTVINIPNYIDNLIFDIIVGQCIFELKNNDDHLLAIVKTPKQIIIGNNRKTEPICHGFIPAKSWLPMMNLLGNEDNTERIHIKAINTPHGVPYWLVSIFDYYKLPASKTFSSLDATEFSSVTFS
ncbi:hypothetical protein FG386_000145 [Cryptosporidium ryanae]|uniref:uncharacterized protein n=1 Tax=Cryptosporidium ryanae TaxID=515981 RepID=UPI003519E5DC|nr:hypothetical protein FG386_000145 [Cryptosporidium ryanae]